MCSFAVCQGSNDGWGGREPEPPRTTVRTREQGPGGKPDGAVISLEQPRQARIGQKFADLCPIQFG